MTIKSYNEAVNSLITTHDDLLHTLETQDQCTVHTASYWLGAAIALKAHRDIIRAGVDGNLAKHETLEALNQLSKLIDDAVKFTRGEFSS